MSRGLRLAAAGDAGTCALGEVCPAVTTLRLLGRRGACGRRLRTRLRVVLLLHGYSPTRLYSRLRVGHRRRGHGVEHSRHEGRGWIVRAPVDRGRVARSARHGRRRGVRAGWEGRGAVGFLYTTGDRCLPRAPRPCDASGVRRARSHVSGQGHATRRRGHSSCSVTSPYRAGGHRRGRPWCRRSTWIGRSDTSEETQAFQCAIVILCLPAQANHRKR